MEQAANLLETENGKGTFFIIASQLFQKIQKRVEKILEKGHAVGNHSFSHARFSTLSSDQIREEIEKSHEALQKIFRQVAGEKDAGKYKNLFRFPYGDDGSRTEKGGSAEKTEEIKETLNEFGYTVVDWEIDPEDWNISKKTNEEMLVKIEDGVEKKKKIILLHEIPNTIEKILPEILKKHKETHEFKAL